MRFMVMVKATRESEAGVMPSQELLQAMGRYNEELVAGFWILQVKSREEAIEWVKRCPNPMPGDSDVEIRQIFEASDFGAEFTPELQEQEERLRAEISAQQQQPG